MTGLPAVLAATVVTLWHATQGAERAALEETVARVNAEAAATGAGFEVRAQVHDFGIFARKLETTIPRGEGPDLFLAAHDRTGDWERMGIIGAFEPVSRKALLLYCNRDLLPEGPPATLAGVRALARERFAPRGIVTLAYDATDFFFHAPLFLSSGGRLFDGDRIAAFDSARSWEEALELKRAGAIPDEPSTALVTELFNSGRAAIVLSGPWFAGYVTLPRERWAAAPLFAGTGSFVSVDGIFVSARARDPAAAARAAAALRSNWRRPTGEDDEVRRAQEPALRNGMITPSRPEMSLIWDPAKDVLRDILQRDLPVEAALARARRAIEIATRPDPPPADPQPYIVAASAILAALALFAAARGVRAGALGRAVRPSSRFAYGLVLPGFVAVLVLVVAPLVAGAAVSLYSHRVGEGYTFVGFSNFTTILGSTDTPLAEPGSFYYILAVTILWTVVNVALHVALGVGLALLLRRPWLALRGFYRVVLILPWAVPSYITALIWKGMFNRQFGAINALLGALALEPVSWFSRFATAFAANVATNTWLGFPFMMVMTLGALQSIPPELEEAAALEGASRWQRLKLVVLPAIRPALVPAVVLGSVWTFNMFNVIYLVSEGEPAGATEILISEAYKWAFVRQHRYGYAAAYAVLIFGILLVYSRAIGGRQEEARA